MHSFTSQSQPCPQLPDNNNLACLNQLICRYIKRHGEVHVGIYQIPDIDTERNFSSYINSVVSSLSIDGYYPVYAWSYDNDNHVYTLVMLVNLYLYRGNNMNDLYSTLTRLYANYSQCQEIVNLYDVGITRDNYIQVKDLLWNQLASTSFSKVPKRSPDTWHKRLFSCSKL